MSKNNIEIVNISDVGRKRPHNEDSTITDEKNGILVLADGMGGYKAGEVASAIAVSDVHQHVKQGLTKAMAGDADAATGLSAVSLLLKKAIIIANTKIYDTATNEKSCHGMGTTVVACLLAEEALSIAHVGDSRVYRLRGDHFEQVTKDHSLIQELVDRGLYTPEEAAENTPKNLVTRALGIDSKVEVDVMEEPRVSGDIYLLCSDGLNDMVNDEEIHLTLSKYSANLAQAANELVNLGEQLWRQRQRTSVILNENMRLMGFCVF